MSYKRTWFTYNPGPQPEVVNLCHHLRVTQLQARVGHRSKNLVAHTAAMAPPSVDLVGHERDQQAQGVRMTSEPL